MEPDLALEAYGLLKDLLRVDTTNPPGDETAAAAVLARFLESHGIPSRLIEKTPGRANLVARVDAAGGAGPILLGAHLDTVPALEEGWHRPPLAAEETGGFLYGRGAIDVKNGVAMAAAALVAARRRGLRRPLILAAVADEERGCELGSRFLAERHPDLVRAEYFLGEGGGMTQWVLGRCLVPIGAGEKGQLIVRATFEGAGGHASMPHRDDAVYRLGRFLARLGEGLPVRVTPPAARFLAALARARGGPVGAAVGAMRFAPAARLVLPLLGPPAVALRAMLSDTASATRILADGAPNAIPASIAVDLDIRTLPGRSAGEVLESVFRATGERPRVQVLHESPAVETRTDTPMFRHLCERVRALVPGASPLPALIPGFTDAKWFSKVAEHCYGFCPVLNDDPAEAARFRVQMHGVNERISKEAFLKGCRLLADAVLSFAA